LERVTYISSATLDGNRPIFVQDGFKLFVVFGSEIAEIMLGPEYGFPIPAIAFVNCYFGSLQLIQEVTH
jgi:hypothetical protein